MQTFFDFEAGFSQQGVPIGDLGVFEDKSETLLPPPGIIRSSVPVSHSSLQTSHTKNKACGEIHMDLAGKWHSSEGASGPEWDIFAFSRTQRSTHPLFCLVIKCAYITFQCINGEVKQLLKGRPGLGILAVSKSLVTVERQASSLSN